MKNCKVCLKVTATTVYCSYSCQEYAWELAYLENKHESELTEKDQNRLNELGKTIECLQLQGKQNEN